MQNTQTVTYRDCQVQYGQVEGGYNYLVTFPSGNMASFGAETLDEMWKRVDESIDKEDYRLKLDYVLNVTNGNYPND